MSLPCTLDLQTNIQSNCSNQNAKYLLERNEDELSKPGHVFSHLHVNISKAKKLLLPLCSLMSLRQALEHLLGDNKAAYCLPALLRIPALQLKWMLPAWFQKVLMAMTKLKLLSLETSHTHIFFFHMNKKLNNFCTNLREKQL